MPDDANSTGWHQYPDWPTPSTATKRLYFTSSKALAETADSQLASLHWEVNAHDAGSDPASGNQKVGVNQADADAKPYRLTFTTAPLAADTVVAGSPEVHLKVAFSANDGNLVARLMEVLPDGTVRQVSTGWLKASHYKGHDHLEAIAPGTACDMQVHVLPAYWQFREAAQSASRCRAATSPIRRVTRPPGTVSVAAGGRDGSYVELPVIAGTPADQR